MKHPFIAFVLALCISQAPLSAVDKTYNDFSEHSAPLAETDWIPFWKTASGDVAKVSPANLFATANLWDYESTWLTATAYGLNDVVTYATALYICTAAHTSGELTEPGVGDDWATVWMQMVPPQQTQTLIQEQIAFGNNIDEFTSEAGFEYDPDTNTFKAPNAQFTGAVEITGSITTVPSPMAALAVDLTKGLNTKSISGNVTVTFSGSLVEGEYSDLRMLNTGASEYTVTLPASVYASYGSAQVSSFTVPPAVAGVNGMKHVSFTSDGTRLRFYEDGGPGGSGGFPNPATSDLNMGSYNINNGGVITATEFVGSMAGGSNIPAGEVEGLFSDDVTYGKMTSAKGPVVTTTTIAPTTSANITVQTGVWENTITLNEAEETIVFDAQPEAGKEFRIRVLVDIPDPDTVCEATFPSTYSYVTQGLRTLLKFPDNKPQLITLWHDGTSYKMTGDPHEIAELPIDTTPATTAIVPIDQGNGTEGASLANIKTALGLDDAKTTRTGVRRTVYIDAGAMIPRTTNGAGTSTAETTTNDVMYDSRDFDQTTSEGVGFWWATPPTWNGGTLTAKFYWTASAGTAAQTVVWSISCRDFTDSDAIDQALGTAQTVSDALLATGDIHISATTPAITPAGDNTSGKPIYFQITRDVSTDDLAADAKLLGVVLEYTESATEPAAQ